MRHAPMCIRKKVFEVRKTASAVNRCCASLPGAIRQKKRQSVNIVSRVLVPSAARIQPCAEDRHQRNDVLGKLCFEGHRSCRVDNMKFSTGMTADESYKPDAESQRPVFVHHCQPADSAFEQQPHKLFQAGFGAVKTGTYVRDHLVAALFTEPFRLSCKVGFLIMGGNSDITDVQTSFGLFCTIRNTETAMSAGGSDGLRNNAERFPTADGTR